MDELDLNQDPWALVEELEPGEPTVPTEEPVVGPPSVPIRDHAANDEQWAYIIDDSTNVTGCMSRRAGKTGGAYIKGARKLCRPGSWSHYVNLRKAQAKEQFFWPLIDYLERPPERKGLGWVRDHDFVANESLLLITTAWGSNLKAFSCPTMADVSGVKGYRSDWFCVDECQDPKDDVIRALIETAAEPMTTDTGGSIDQLGTPPEVEPCQFSEALDNPEYSHHFWTQFDHDLPRSREEKWADVKAKLSKRHLRFSVAEGKDDQGRLELTVDPNPANTHPTVLREYFGLRAKDPKRVAYEYADEVNLYDPAGIDFSQGRWQVIWGLDLAGGQADDADHTAIVVGVSKVGDPEKRVYVRWQWQCRHVDSFRLADVARVVKAVLPPGLVIGDDGGHAAIATLQGLGRVLSLVIEPKPRDVMVSLRHTNDDLRAARLLVPSQDVLTAVILAKVREVYAAPMDRERLEVVTAMLTPVDQGGLATPADLATELPRVLKSVNPRTKKVTINRRQGHGIHSDISEAFRYMHSGFVRGPAAPSKPAITDPNQAAAAAITKQLREAWLRKQGRFPGYR